MAPETAGGGADAVRAHYPRTVTLADGGTVTLRLMTPDDVEAVLAFAKSLDPDELLYLRVNITEPGVVERWAHYIEAGRTETVLALAGDSVAGEASLLHNRTSWTRHLGEIRLQVAPRHRRRGLARLLTDEVERIARTLNLRMLTARMTLDQVAAQSVFRRLGFQREAVLWDYVMTADGNTRNLLVATKRL
jgi:RimJ/RimL family protein N-acetyltransferase